MKRLFFVSFSFLMLLPFRSVAMKPQHNLKARIPGYNDPITGACYIRGQYLGNAMNPDAHKTDYCFEDMTEKACHAKKAPGWPLHTIFFFWKSGQRCNESLRKALESSKY